jgi:hypothetical protein
VSWANHHSESERLASQAEEAARRGDHAGALRLYGQAGDAEYRALEAIEPNKARTFGITAVSTVALYFKADDYGQAQRVAHRCLAMGLLPSFAVDQLQSLLQSIWTTEASQRAGIRFTGKEVIVSVKGGQVVPGGAPLELIVQKVEQVSALFYRAAELLLKSPHRKRGLPAKEIQDVCRPWLFQTAPGSYQFAVRVEQPKQLTLFPSAVEQLDALPMTFLKIVKASVDDPDGALPDLVPDLEYRATFLRLARNLAPSGDAFSRLEMRPAGSPEVKPIILVPASREMITGSLRRQAPPAEETAKRKEVRLSGVLRALHLDKDWLEIAASHEGQHIRVYGAGETVDDVVGPMVNRLVTIDAVTGSFGRYHLVDIQPAE